MEIPAVAAISKLRLPPVTATRIQRLAFLPHPAYAHGVKSILLYLVASVAFSILGGCASGKKKSGARLYEGDTSPNIKMFDEKPGYPLNNL